MSEFRTMVITDKGQALIAKVFSEGGKIEFTKISVSDVAYSDEQIQAMTTIEGVKQSTNVSRVIREGNSAVLVEGAVNNTDLTSGYYMKTIVLHALDLDGEEIIYAGCSATVPGWIPPFNGVSSCGAFFRLVTKISNADDVTFEENPAAYATIGDIRYLQECMRYHTRKNLLINGDFSQDTSREGWWEAREEEMWTVDCWKAKNCDVEFGVGVEITGIEGAEGCFYQWLDSDEQGFDYEKQGANVYTLVARVDEKEYSITANDETAELDSENFKMRIEKVINRWGNYVFCVKFIPKGTNTIWIEYADLYEGKCALPHRVEGYEEALRRNERYISEGNALASIYRRKIDGNASVFEFGVRIPQSLTYSKFKSLSFRYYNTSGNEVWCSLEDLEEETNESLRLTIFRTKSTCEPISDDCLSVYVDYLIDGQENTEPYLP